MTETKVKLVPNPKGNGRDAVCSRCGLTVVENLRDTRHAMFASAVLVEHQCIGGFKAPNVQLAK